MLIIIYCTDEIKDNHEMDRNDIEIQMIMKVQWMYMNLEVENKQLRIMILFQHNKMKMNY